MTLATFPEMGAASVIGPENTRLALGDNKSHGDLVRKDNADDYERGKEEYKYGKK